MKYLLYMVLVCGFYTSAFAAADSRFADALFEAAEYRAAILEYERLNFFCADSMLAPRWNYRIGRCLMGEERYAAAVERFAQVPEGLSFSDSARLLAARAALRTGDRVRAVQYASSCTTAGAYNLNAWALVLDGRTSQASAVMRDVCNRRADDRTACALAAAIDEYCSFRSRRSWVAAALAVVPGLGHVYTGRYGDAAASALTVGTCVGISAWYAVNGAQRRAALAGSVAGLFYAGSIYGAVVSVRLYNRDGRAKRLRAAEKIVWGE